MYRVQCVPGTLRGNILEEEKEEKEEEGEKREVCDGAKETLRYMGGKS